MRTELLRRAAVLPLALILLVGGCGGDGAPEESGSPTGAATAGTEATDGQTEASPGEASPAETGTPTETATAGTEPTAAGTGGAYVVQSGDTLTSIAEEFGTTVDAIVEANDLDDPDVIAIGQELVIPPGS